MPRARDIIGDLRSGISGAYSVPSVRGDNAGNFFRAFGGANQGIQNRQLLEEERRMAQQEAESQARYRAAMEEQARAQAERQRAEAEVLRNPPPTVQEDGPIVKKYKDVERIAGKEYADRWFSSLYPDKPKDQQGSANSGLSGSNITTLVQKGARPLATEATLPNVPYGPRPDQVADMSVSNPTHEGNFRLTDAGGAPLPWEMPSAQPQNPDTSLSEIEAWIKVAGGDVAKGMELFQKAQIERKNAGPSGGGSGDQGDDRLLNAIYDNPKLFTGLTPTQKQKLIPPLADRGFSFPDKLSAAQQNRVASLEVMLEQTKMLGDLAAKHPGAIGPIRGTIASATRGNIGVPFVSDETEADINDLHRIADNLADQLLRARSGAQINEKEFARLRKLMPDPKTSTEKFQSDLRLFVGELTSLRDALVGDAPTGRAEKKAASTDTPKPPEGTVWLISPRGVRGATPVGKVKEAIAKGFTRPQ